MPPRFLYFSSLNCCATLILWCDLQLQVCRSALAFLNDGKSKKWKANSSCLIRSVQLIVHKALSMSSILIIRREQRTVRNLSSLNSAELIASPMRVYVSTHKVIIHILQIFFEVQGTSNGSTKQNILNCYKALSVERFHVTSRIKDDTNLRSRRITSNWGIS